MLDVFLCGLVAAGAFVLVVVGLAVKKRYLEETEEKPAAAGQEKEKSVMDKQLENVLNYGVPGYRQQEVDNENE